MRMPLSSARVVPSFTRYLQQTVRVPRSDAVAFDGGAPASQRAANAGSAVQMYAAAVVAFVGWHAPDVYMFVGIPHFGWSKMRSAPVQVPPVTVHVAQSPVQ